MRPNLCLPLAAHLGLRSTFPTPKCQRDLQFFEGWLIVGTKLLSLGLHCEPHNPKISHPWGLDWFRDRQEPRGKILDGNSESLTLPEFCCWPPALCWISSPTPVIPMELWTFQLHLSMCSRPKLCSCPSYTLFWEWQKWWLHVNSAKEWILYIKTKNGKIGPFSLNKSYEQSICIRFAFLGINF